MLLNAFPSLVFFNGGMLSGASQKHKHFQLIPLEKENYSFGLLYHLENNSPVVIQQNDCFSLETVKIFKFDHLLVRFSESTTEKLSNICLESLENNAFFLHELYFQLLSELNLLEDKEKITKDYSFLLTKRFLLVIPRKKDRFEVKNSKFFLNSVSYLLSILVRGQENREILEETDILDQISNL